MTITIENVAFAYGARQILDDVTLEIPTGSRFALAGPNGAGKSTLLRLIARLLEPAAGQVLLDGRDLTRWGTTELARKVAVVPQETVVEFPFTAFEVVLMGRYPHLGGSSFERPDDVAAAERALAQTDATHLAGRAFHTLSGGEKQRVVVARALTQEPEVLLLDEPATFLDLRHVVELFDLLTDLATERRLTLVMVLHDLNLASIYADRMAFLKDGRILAAGPTAEVLTYANVRQTFDVEVYVDRNDLTGRLTVLPMDRKERDEVRRRFGTTPEGRPIRSAEDPE